MAERLAHALMLQGTSSSVGKSYLAAGLCRLYARRGLRVAPFKAQNMALNAAVTPDGAEIGRAQAMQAEAAGVAPEAVMNPILLKAEDDRTCQVVLMGRPLGTYRASQMYTLRQRLWPHVRTALHQLRQRFDLVIIEGAGSPAEVNLRQGEIVNMRVAKEANAPVLLVGDVDRGGVFAALLGTLSLLRPSERRQVAGLIINRFRGDPTLFADGAAFLEQRARLPVLGIVPHLDHVRLPAEDSLELPSLPHRSSEAVLDLAIVRLERISNFDELQPLGLEPGVNLRLVTRGDELGQPDLVIVPGTKTTLKDLAQLRTSGLAEAIRRAREAGAAVLGICGGYQMLGRYIDDPKGVELAGSAPGLDLLPTWTRFEPGKVTVLQQGRVLDGPGLLSHARGLEVRGYEIHAGRVRGEQLPVWDLGRHHEGCRSPDGWVLGTSLHGVMTNPKLRRAILEALAERRGVRLPPPALEPPDPYDALADALEAALDLATLDRIVGLMP
jgi:adenosylcobyric acid synthase